MSWHMMARPAEDLINANSGLSACWGLHVIYSGLDWSGSPGKEHGPWLVFAVAHIDRSEIPSLDHELAEAKHDLHVGPDYVFSHNGTGPETRSAFFAAVRRTSITSHVHILDKAAWAAQQIGKPTGPRCIRDGILTLIVGCPDAVVAGNVLYIDMRSHQEGMTLEGCRTEIRQTLRAARPPRFGFKNVRACPDHRLHGGLIQVADMIAGEVRKHGGILGPQLQTLGRRIHLV